tara:strand:- start:12 stop:674 length:663 start_codon:yes stop_codon:yes gene_type:complete
MNEKYVCTVCYEKDLEVINIVCGHISTCMSCSTNKCPICRTSGESIRVSKTGVIVIKNRRKDCKKLYEDILRNKSDHYIVLGKNDPYYNYIKRTMNSSSKYNNYNKRSIPIPVADYFCVKCGRNISTNFNDVCGHISTCNDCKKYNYCPVCKCSGNNKPAYINGIIDYEYKMCSDEFSMLRKLFDKNPLYKDHILITKNEPWFGCVKRNTLLMTRRSDPK